MTCFSLASQAPFGDPSLLRPLRKDSSPVGKS